MCPIERVGNCNVGHCAFRGGVILELPLSGSPLLLSAENIDEMDDEFLVAPDAKVVGIGISRYQDLTVNGIKIFNMASSNC